MVFLRADFMRDQHTPTGDSMKRMTPPAARKSQRTGRTRVDLFRQKVREAYRRMVAQGWTDALREPHPADHGAGA